MRINNLYIKEFKNIKEQTFDFSKHNGLTVVIGNNGSGKSNLIEAISAIFYDILKNEEICLIRDAEIEIIANNSSEIIAFQNGEISIGMQGVAGVYLTRIKPSIIPQKVVAIYSGEEERLKKNYFDKFLDDYINSQNVELPQMVFLNKTHWDIALLCLLYSDTKQGTKFCEELLPNIKILTIRFDFNALPSKLTNEVLYFLKELNELPSKPYFSVNEFMSNVDIDVIKLFQYLYFAKSQKKPLIDAIRFEFYKDSKLTGLRKKTKRELQISNFDLTSLSEGQKKQLLVTAALEFAAQENSLFLLDEPDVHVHIGNKRRILEHLSQYTHNRHIFISTHSPTLCKYAPKDSILLMEKGVVKPLKDELEAGKYLADDNDVFKLLFSIKHIVITEGKTDCQYIKKAIELYQIEYPELTEIEFVSIGGTDGEVVKEFLTKIRKINARKVIVLVDRDDAGLGCVKKVLEIDKLELKDVDYKQIQLDNTQYILMYPNPIGNDRGLVIEDYFGNAKLKELALKCVDENYKTNTSLKSFPNVKNNIKDKYLKNLCDTATKEDVKGFLPLLDKLKTIINADYGTVEISQKGQPKPRLQSQKNLTITNTFYQE